MMKVSGSAGVPLVSSVGPVVMQLLLVRSSQKRITRWLYYVICKQRKDKIWVIERESISTARTMDCLS